MRVLAALALVVTLGLVGGVASAQPRTLDRGELDSMVGEQPPQVVLLTMGVGPRIFEKFGHAALCLAYPETGREPVCFNYGVTDFEDATAMVWGFLRGVQKFWVEPESWSDMVRFYEAEDRDIYEQELPLSPEQARAVERELLTTLEPAHRYYHYDHFENNCTTRLRDIIDRATGGALHAGSDRTYPLTYRQIGYRGLSGLPPLIALADFVIGRALDENPTLWQAMFHPDVLRQQVATTLGVQPRVIHARVGPAFPTSGSTWRLQMLALSLVFSLPLLVATWRGRGERIAVAWATVYLAVWGLVVWTLVIVSAIPGVRWNENVLVFVPLDLVLPLLSHERRRQYARVRVVGLLLVSALAAIGILHQPVWIPVLCALIPLAIIAFDQTLQRSRVAARPG